MEFEFGDELTATSGSNGTGTWAWSYQTLGCPAENRTVEITITDERGETLTGCFLLQVDNVAPTVTIHGPPTGALHAVESGVLFEAEISDPGLADTHSAEWTFTSSTTGESWSVPGTVAGHSVADTIEFLEPGVYYACLSVTDSDGDSGESCVLNDDADLPVMVVIYDSSGGFVTGGGWIQSPSGALHQDWDATATGKAHFGFVAKYKNGATAPDGHTEFQFQAGNLTFSSDSYDWLVVAGARAQFKGSGSVNGLPGYSFMLTAIDSAINGGGAEDRFRIRIWWETDEDFVLYDNKRGTDDDASEESTTALSGGRIVIHRAK